MSTSAGTFPEAQQSSEPGCGKPLAPCPYRDGTCTSMTHPSSRVRSEWVAEHANALSRQDKPPTPVVLNAISGTT
ncbi:hypothetical protein M3J09_011798 [Ascochyta lentis]